MTDEVDEAEVPDLPEEHYAAIGRVAERWAAFELLIDMTCWKLAGMNDGMAGTCLTAQITGHARKLDAFTSLVRLRGGDPTLMKRINKLAEKARGLAERRNRVVHDPWLSLQDSPHRYEATARKTAVLDAIPMTTSEVNALADHIDEFWIEFRTIREAALLLLADECHKARTIYPSVDPTSPFPTPAA